MGAVRSTVKRACLPSPIGRTSAIAAAEQQTDRGVAAPNGARRELLGEREAEVVARGDRVDALDGASACSSSACPACATNASRRLAAARARSPGRRRAVAAVGEQVLVARAQPAEQVKAGNAASRAASALPVEADQHGGPVVASAIRAATIPITPGCQPSPASTYPGSGPAAHLRLRLEADPRLDVAALAVGAIEFLRQLRGALGAVGQQQLERRGGR